MKDWHSVVISVSISFHGRLLGKVISSTLLQALASVQCSWLKEPEVSRNTGNINRTKVMDTYTVCARFL